MKSFWDQANQGLRALLGAPQSVHAGVISALFAGNVQQLLLGTHDMGEQDVRVFLPLVTVGERKRRGPIYSVVFTDVAIHLDGFLGKATAPDPDIPKSVANASWIETPGVWRNVVEKLSWTMLAKQKPGCQFKSVQCGWQ